MHSARQTSIRFLECIISCILLLLAWPIVVAVYLTLLRVAGDPVIVTDSVPRDDGTVAKSFRFRTTGPGTSPFHGIAADCDLEAELRTLGWSEFFIKDYVKSLKTSVGSRISKPEQVAAVVADMHRFRGVVEGGFCVRRVEAFLPATERRYFVLDGVPPATTGDPPPIVHECAKRLQSRFYSVDVVQRADGRLRIVEVGDGQVSDLVGWTPLQFASVLAEHFQQDQKLPGSTSN